MKEDNNKYWKSIEELKSPQTFNEAAKNEFPDNMLEAPDKMTRKKFLSIMGASIALASLSGCRKPVEKIVPYVANPETITPGVSNYYATTVPFGMNSYGVIVKSNEGRPTYIEGNPNHSSSLGATNGFVQASILDLYDPDRSTYISKKNQKSSINELKKELKTALEGNKKVRVLSSSFSSPSMKKIKNLIAKNKNVDWVCFDRMNNENEYDGIKLATGTRCKAIYHFNKADRVLSIDSDFLNLDENPIYNTKKFSEKRKVRGKHHKKATMNRLYVVESNMSQTGALADNRLRLKQSDIDLFVFDLWNHVVKGKISKQDWINKLYNDLKSHKSVVKGGARLSAESHAMIAQINKELNSIGKTVEYIPLNTQDVNCCPSDHSSYKELLSDIKKGDIACLIMLDSNPVYTSSDIVALFKKIPLKIHFGMHYDETASLCDWHVPKAHYLESWGDCESIDGTQSIIQPLISQLYKDSLSDLDFAIMLLKEMPNGNDKSMKDISNAYQLIYDMYKAQWKKYLYNGWVRSGYPNSYGVNKNNGKNWKGKKDFNLDKKPNKEIEMVFYTSGNVYDGRFANNGWLQENPDSISKITWDNAALMSAKTAKKLGYKNKELINLKANGGSVLLPVWILPGHADNQISVQVGYGRSFKSRIAENVGGNVYPLMNGSYSSSVNHSSTGKMYTIACTQDHHGMNSENPSQDAADKEVQKRLPDIYRELTLDEYRNDGPFNKVGKIDKNKHLEDKNGKLKTLYDNPYEEIYDRPYDPANPPQWAMSIDLNSCTGCNACAIACQSENNIPIVGKDQVEKGREMNWIRLDRYYKGTDSDNPEVAFQPVACVHCENAPCEQVCPVSATVHDDEGLNVMVYNRCIGTRYCANNCPYKVRRFNFHNYTLDTPDIVQMAHNPDVTVRFRGVMEKCTFCIQRIKEVEHKSKVEKKPVENYNLKTACQSACPADCVDFGNKQDPHSDIYKSRNSERSYSLLAELNTRPRTTYLAKIRNPNKKIKKPYEVYKA